MACCLFGPKPLFKPMLIWTLRNKLKWNLNWNTNIFIDKNVFENIICKIAAILSGERWVKTVFPQICHTKYLRLRYWLVCVQWFPNMCYTHLWCMERIYIYIYMITFEIMMSCFHHYIFSCDQAAIWLVQSVLCLSVCPSVRPSHLFHHVPIIISSWNFQELLPMTKVTSMQKVKVRGQRSRSQRSTPNLTVSGL